MLEIFEFVTFFKLVILFMLPTNADKMAVLVGAPDVADIMRRQTQNYDSR